MSWHDIHIKQKSEKKHEYLARVKYDKIVCDRADSFKKIIGGNIEPGVQYRLISTLAFNAIVVLQYIQQLYKIDEIYLVIYRMNEKSVNKFKELIDNDTHGGFLISSFFRNNKIYEKWARNLVNYCAGNNNMQISFAVTHAKIFIAKTADGKHIVFEGSGNFSDNARIEQYLLEDNKEVYNFHKKWITEILNDEQKN